MTDLVLTAAARRYVARLMTALAPHADRLDRRFRAFLLQRGCHALQIRAFLAITPAAASRLPARKPFFEQVHYHARRLAKLNVEPEDAARLLKAFDGLLDAILPAQFQPAREQLHLATVLVLNRAYYQVREAETQAFFGLYRAAAEAREVDDLMPRFAAVLAQAMGAEQGRLLPADRSPRGAGARYRKHGDRSCWRFPMGPQAALELEFDRPYPWLPREAELLRAAAEHCREALERARLEGEIRRLQAESARAEEEERHRIARELHDEAGQSLLALRLQLEMLERVAGAPLRPRLAEARAVVERTVEELRRIVAALSPAVLERLGLRSAIRQLAARFRKIHPAQIGTRFSGHCDGFPRRFQEVIYRVAQECLQNIAKHSQANRVNLRLESTDQFVRLSVSDNGAGFRQEEASSKPMSLGLAGMRERAALLAGKLAIRSAPGKGVAIVLTLPQPSAAETSHAQNSRITH